MQFLRSKNKAFIVLLIVGFSTLFLFQNFTTVNLGQLYGVLVVADERIAVQGLQLNKKWMQGIWKFSEDPSLYLVSQDPDGRDGHDHVSFHLVRIINGSAEVLVSFENLPAGTHAQSIYAEALDKYNYNIYTENADRRGISLFKLKFDKNLFNTKMRYVGDIYPKDSRGGSLFFHVFAVNHKTGLLVTGSLGSGKLTLQRYDKNSFLKPIKIGSEVGESRAVPKYSSLVLKDVQSLQGIGLSESKAYVLRGSFASGSEDKNIYVADFKNGNDTNFILFDVWDKKYKAEPEGLFVQGKELIFGLQGNVLNKNSSNGREMQFHLYKIKLP